MPGGANLRPAFNAAAFHDLLAELYSQLAPGMPGNSAKAERGVTIKTQPEYGRQVLGIGKIHERPVLRYVAHGAAQVFSLERVKNRSRHVRGTPRGTAFFNDFKVTFHWLTRPRNFGWRQAYA
jgi:hypothetical protein